MGIAKKVTESGQTINAILVIGFIGIVWLMIYGNLSGNLGFATPAENVTNAGNNSEAVIGNLTEGISVFFGFSVTWFTILAIVLLIVILLGLLAIVMKISKSKGSGFKG